MSESRAETPPQEFTFKHDKLKSVLGAIRVQQPRASNAAMPSLSHKSRNHPIHETRSTSHSSNLLIQPRGHAKSPIFATKKGSLARLQLEIRKQTQELRQTHQTASVSPSNQGRSFPECLRERSTTLQQLPKQNVPESPYSELLSEGESPARESVSKQHHAWTVIDGSPLTAGDSGEGGQGKSSLAEGWLRRHSVWGETPKDFGRRGGKREDNEVYYSSVEGTQETRPSSELGKPECQHRDMQQAYRLSDTLHTPEQGGGMSSLLDTSSKDSLERSDAKLSTKTAEELRSKLFKKNQLYISEKKKEIRKAEKQLEETVRRLEKMEHETHQQLEAKIHNIDSVYEVRLRELEKQFRREKQRLDEERKIKIQQETRAQEQMFESRASLEFGTAQRTLDPREESFTHKELRAMAAFPHTVSHRGEALFRGHGRGKEGEEEQSRFEVLRSRLNQKMGKSGGGVRSGRRPSEEPLCALFQEGGFSTLNSRPLLKGAHSSFQLPSSGVPRSVSQHKYAGVRGARATPLFDFTPDPAWSQQPLSGYSSIARSNAQCLLLPQHQTIFPAGMRRVSPSTASPVGVIGVPASPLEQRVQQRAQMFNTLSLKYSSASRHNLRVSEAQKEKLSRSFEERRPSRHSTLGREGKENEPAIAIFNASSSSNEEADDQDST